MDAAWEPHRLLRVGALRSPVRTPEQATAMARRITATPGLRLTGVLAYEGQVAGVPEGTGPRSAAARGVKRASMRDLAARRPAVVAAVRAVAREAGADLEFVNGGGTGSAGLTAQDSSVTEIGAGSGLMGPASFDGFRGLDLRPASFFTRPVVRRPRPEVVTVAGGGWVASGMPGTDRLPAVAWPTGLRSSPQEAAGEVQTPLRGAAAGGPTRPARPTHRNWSGAHGWTPAREVRPGSADKAGLAVASAHLGHTSETVTAAHYRAKAPDAADMRTALAAFWSEEEW